MLIQIIVIIILFHNQTALQQTCCTKEGLSTFGVFGG